MSAVNLPKKMYFVVWAALLALLLLTWGLAEFDLGAFNTPVAIAISITKMTLVVLFFMHLRYEQKLTWVFAAAGMIWFLIMVDLTLSDYLTRGSAPGTRQSWQHGSATSDKEPPRLPDTQ